MFTIVKTGSVFEGDESIGTFKSKYDLAGLKPMKLL
jgi:hypothetical protein